MLTRIKLIQIVLKEFVYHNISTGCLSSYRGNKKIKHTLHLDLYIVIVFIYKLTKFQSIMDFHKTLKSKLK